jgi:SAM-dependent methyltransferase
MPSATAKGAPAPPVASDAGLRRSIALARVFPLEQSDPDTFYKAVAADTVSQIERYADVAGRLVLDVGGGGGYFAAALASAGAACILVEPAATGGAPPTATWDGLDAEERHRLATWPGRLAPGRTVAADGYQLPFADAVADVSFSSNVLEHVADPYRLVGELLRVTRPGGLLYLSFTVWYSPWGGHETAPWHYLGGERAAQHYEARHGHPPKNRFGRSLFACHVGPMLRMAQGFTPHAEVIDARPRYYPDWLRWVVKVPGLRELVTWNLLVIMRRTPLGGQVCA